jgi:hypothetical protein
MKAAAVGFAASPMGIPATMETAASLAARRICAWDAAMIEGAGMST